MMGSTYAQVMEESEGEWRIQLADLVLLAGETPRLMVPPWIDKKKRPDTHVLGKVTVAETSGGVNELETYFIQIEESDVKRSAEEFENEAARARVNHVGEHLLKIEHMINELNETTSPADFVYGTNDIKPSQPHSNRRQDSLQGGGAGSSRVPLGASRAPGGRLDILDAKVDRILEHLSIRGGGHVRRDFLSTYEA